MIKNLKRKREAELKARKNFLPSLLLTISLWVSLAAIIFLINPDQHYAVALLVVNLFFALLFTFSIILANTRQGFLISIGLTALLLLKYFGVASPLTLILLALTIIVFEILFERNT